MAGKLTNAASRIFGGNGIVGRSVASSLRLRSGIGPPVGEHIGPDKPLPVNADLVWENGTPFPEPCVDRIADTVGKYEALAWLCGGLGFFASLGLLAVWNDKASKIPFATFSEFGSVCKMALISGVSVYGPWSFMPKLCSKFGLYNLHVPQVQSWLYSRASKVSPYDNLRVELGGEPWVHQRQ